MSIRINTYRKFTSGILLIIYIGCSMPLEIVEIFHIISHTKDFIGGLYHPHSLDSEVHHHTHIQLDLIDTHFNDDGQESPNPVSDTDQKKVQFIDFRKGFNKFKYIDKSTQNITYQYFTYSIFLKHDTPPPKFMS